MDRKRIEIPFFLMLFAGVFFLTFLVFKPFIQVLVLGAVAAVIFQPFYKRVLPAFRHHKNFAAFATVLIVALFLVIPLFYVGVQIFQQTQNIYVAILSDSVRYTDAIQQGIEMPMRQIFPGFTFDVQDYAIRSLEFFSDNFSTLLSQTIEVIFKTFLFLMAFFFFLRDGERMFAKVVSLSPFENHHDTEILNTTRRTVVAVIRQTLVVIVIRWVLVGLGFYFCGIPNAAFWGSIAGIVGAIPSFGTPVVIIPAAIYLYLQGDIVPTVGIVLVGLFIMLVIENILAPYMLGKGFDVSPLFALLSIFGGLVLFGPFGLIFGPLILSLFLSMIRLYRILL